MRGASEVAQSLASRLYYVAGETDDAGLYQRLQARLTEINGAEGVLFYLAIPPTIYGTVIEQLGKSKLSEAPARGWRRIVIEKPFGTDLESARALNRLAHEYFDEDQVYRIDHYLGKETVQNLLVFRFGNGMFEPVWNRRYIDHVQITAAETVGVEHRASYYEGAGAVRDMVQNHLMQVLSLIAMEPPTAFTAESVRDRKMDALLAVQPLVASTNGKTAPVANVVRAQYETGWVNGAEAPGYRSEKDVAPGSTTETYAAVRFNLDNWRWAGVPFYVRTGKRLPKRTTEIAIQFRRPPLEIFRRASQSSLAPNLLIVNVQPDEGISLRFETKLPGNAHAGCAGDDELPLRRRRSAERFRKRTRRCCSTRCSAIRRSSPGTTSSRRRGRSLRPCSRHGEPRAGKFRSTKPANGDQRKLTSSWRMTGTVGGVSKFIHSAFNTQHSALPI